MIILIVVTLFGFWYGFQLVLNSEYPALAVASGSMCTVQGMRCDGWSHPFETTLHVGDLIIVQGVNRKEIRINDIIVFHKPKPIASSTDELIVHRVYATELNPNNDMIYFETKGDASNTPDFFDTDYRGENYTWHSKISEKLVVGKVVLRIPWVGHVSLFMRNSSGIFVIVILIIIIVILEFVIPAFKSKKAETEPMESVENAFEA